jgi:hypothetical protein
MNWASASIIPLGRMLQYRERQGENANNLLTFEGGKSKVT